MANVGMIFLFILLCFTQVRKAFIIESCVGTAVFGSLAYVAPKVWCRFKECCTDRWISANITGLQSALRRRVFGQHLVTETMFKAIVGHLNNKSPSKALALSFNGWTGSGKNFVSKILQSIFLGRGWKVNLSIKSLPPMTSHTSRNWTVINDICVVWFLVQCHSAQDRCSFLTKWIKCRSVS